MIYFIIGAVLGYLLIPFIGWGWYLGLVGGYLFLDNIFNSDEDDSYLYDDMPYNHDSDDEILNDDEYDFGKDYILDDEIDFNNW